jgi:hypothetical protein
MKKLCILRDNKVANRPIIRILLRMKPLTHGARNAVWFLEHEVLLCFIIISRPRDTRSELAEGIGIQVRRKRDPSFLDNERQCEIGGLVDVGRDGGAENVGELGGMDDCDWK